VGLKIERSNPMQKQTKMRKNQKEGERKGKGSVKPRCSLIGPELCTAVLNYNNSAGGVSYRGSAGKMEMLNSS
jgi:hypothetical protein